MEFFETIQRRRSVREYNSTPVPADVINKALDAALIAPNSSNMQSWNFIWVKSPEKKQKTIEACLNQTAARTAQELLVFVATTENWQRHSAAIVEDLKNKKSPQRVLDYYEKLIPALYGWSWLAPLKFVLSHLSGIFRPTPRKPWSKRDNLEVAIKSCALAAENFMLAISAQGFDTCPMEGFDECRLKKLLNLKCNERVVMVISVGQRAPHGVWGTQFRVPKDWVVKEI